MRTAEYDTQTTTHRVAGDACFILQHDYLQIDDGRSGLRPVYQTWDVAYYACTAAGWFVESFPSVDWKDRRSAGRLPLDSFRVLCVL